MPAAIHTEMGTKRPSIFKTDQEMLSVGLNMRDELRLKFVIRCSRKATVNISAEQQRLKR